MPLSTQRAYHHRGSPLPLLGRTVDGFFQEIVDRFPEREAVVSIPQGKRRSYLELRAEVNDLARGLLALGVERGDRVGIWATDNAEWVLVQLATARIGAILVNVNPAYRGQELEHALSLAEVQTLFLIPSFRSSDYVATLGALCPEVERAGELRSARFPFLRRLVVYDPADPRRTERPAPGFRTWQEVLDAGHAVDAAQVAARAAALDPDDPINIQFTSGTTGFPKAVELTHHNILNNAYFTGHAMGFTPADRLCVPVPFYHCFGMVVSTLVCLTHGAALVIPAPHFEAGATLAAIEQEHCTALHGVPTMFIEELERDDFADYDLESLRTGIMAGAPCAPEIVGHVIEEMGCRDLLIGYGQTEASPITHLTHADDDFTRRVGTVGTNLPHQEVKVVDPRTGALLRCDEQGEVCFRGYHVMRGYYGNPAATRQAIDDAGWLHSGDLGVLDAQGYLQITGRLKDMIIRGGENIYPAEIEAFYYEHPDVAEIAVFGLPDERMGEIVGAWIRLHEGATTTPDELRAWAKGRMAHFKIPEQVRIVDSFPMTVTGKIQKFRIREQAAEEQP